MRIKLWALSLLAVMVVSACTPAAAPAPSVVQPTAAVEATQPPDSDPAPIPTTQTPAESEPVVVVTPRGDQLEATDPSTVNLASGQPQLVEFFRFT